MEAAGSLLLPSKWESSTVEKQEGCILIVQASIGILMTPCPALGAVQIPRLFCELF